jgi:hypothetical protein
MYRWMHAMGFTRDLSRKTYYVDGHEKPEQQEHRAKFITTYMTEIEPRCHRWVQLSMKELDRMECNTIILNKGFRYQDKGTDMVEFHVDDHEEL